MAAKQKKRRFTAFKNQVLGLIRKAVFWNQQHTGAEVARVANTSFKTRVRKQRKKAGFNKRKKALFFQPHTGATDTTVIQLFRMKIRKRKGKVKKGRRMVMSMMPNGHTGFSPVGGSQRSWVSCYVNRRGDQ